MESIPDEDAVCEGRTVPSTVAAKGLKYYIKPCCCFLIKFERIDSNIEITCTVGKGLSNSITYYREIL